MSKNQKKRKAENPTQIGTVWTPLKSAPPAEDRPDATAEQLRDRIAELKESGQRKLQRIRELELRGRPDATAEQLRDRIAELKESGQRNRQRIRELELRGRIKTDAMLVLLQELKTDVQEEF